MTKIEFGFGIGLDRDGLPLSVTDIQSGLDTIRAQAVALFGGCTLINTQGEWMDAVTGHIYSEHGITLFILVPVAPDEGEIQSFAETIKTALRQKAVYCVRYPVTAAMI